MSVHLFSLYDANHFVAIVYITGNNIGVTSPKHQIMPVSAMKILPLGNLRIKIVLVHWW